MTGGQGDKGTADEKRLPDCAYLYFWDIDPESLDVREYPYYDMHGHVIHVDAMHVLAKAAKSPDVHADAAAYIQNRPVL